MHKLNNILSTILALRLVVLHIVVDLELELVRKDSMELLEAAQNMEEAAVVDQDMEVLVYLHMEAAVSEAVEDMVVKDPLDVDIIRTQDSNNTAMINQELEGMAMTVMYTTDGIRLMGLR